MKDIWEFKDVGKRNLICYNSESIRHPAKMELNMCRKIIKLYSKPGDLILDPMAGIGSTVVEGMILGRNVFGVEYEDKFVKLAAKNISKVEKSMGFMNSLGSGKVVQGDSRVLSKVLINDYDSIIFSQPYANENKGMGLNKRKQEGKLTKDDIRMGNCVNTISEDKNNIDNIKNYGCVDTIITSPPFADQEWIKKHAPRKHTSELYSENKNDKKQLGNLKGKTYLSEMLKIYFECYKVLKPNGYLVLVTKNFVRKGERVRLDLDTIKLCEQAGFKIFARHYRKINNPSFWITNAIQKFEKKFPGKPHPYPLTEDVLVFKK